MTKAQKFDFEVDDLDGTDYQEDVPEDTSAPAESYPIDQEADEVVSGTLETQAVDEVLEDLSAAEARLDVAQAYRMLLSGSLFSNPTSGSARVEQEVRAFAKDRLEVLLGVRPEVQKKQATDVFTEEEIDALKKLANATLKKLGGITPAAPTLRQVEEPKPALVQREAKVQPVQVRKPAPPPPAPRPQTPARQQPQRQQAQRPVEPQGSKVPPNNALASRVPDQYKNDPTLIYKSGKAFVQARNADGEPLWQYDPVKRKNAPLLKDVTMPAQPAPGGPKPIPMPQFMAGAPGVPPSSPVFDQAMAAHGDAMLSFAERKAEGMKIGNHLAQTVVQNLTQSSDEDDTNERQ